MDQIDIEQSRKEWDQEAWFKALADLQRHAYALTKEWVYAKADNIPVTNEKMDAMIDTLIDDLIAINEARGNREL